MQCSWPEFGVLLVGLIGVVDGGDVVGERVEPDVHDVLGVPRHRDAPAEGGSRHGEVPESPLLRYERHDFVPSSFGTYGVRQMFSLVSIRG